MTNERGINNIKLTLIILVVVLSVLVIPLPFNNPNTCVNDQVLTPYVIHVNDIDGKPLPISVTLKVGNESFKSAGGYVKLLLSNNRPSEVTAYFFDLPVKINGNDSITITPYLYRCKQTLNINLSVNRVSLQWTRLQFNSTITNATIYFTHVLVNSSFTFPSRYNITDINGTSKVNTITWQSSNFKWNNPDFTLP